jgi:hypothetical protein
VAPSTGESTDRDGDRFGGCYVRAF